MKIVYLFITIILFSAFISPQNPKKVIFFGDSITQAGVQKGGYITLMKEILQEKGKATDYDLIGAGIGGNKVYDLYLRMEKDVVAQNPDVVVLYVGVNDVWHKASFGTGTDADKFKKFYVALIEKFKEKGIKVICCTPAVIGERTDFSNQQDGDLNLYSTIIRQIATENACDLIDLRKAFLEYNLTNNPQNLEKGILTTDRVHLNEKGNRLVADLMLAAIMK